MTDIVSSSSIIATLLEEHFEEASFLWLQRASAVRAPNYSPNQFADLDERLEAHLDGLRVAGEEGWQLVEAGLENEGPEDFFPAAVLALEGPIGRFEALLDRVGELPEVIPALISALGWSPWQLVEPRVKVLLEDASPAKQKLALAGYAVHRKDPGSALARCLGSPVDSVRIRALRTVGELGRRDLLAPCLANLSDAKPEVRFWAAWPAVLLGDRDRGLRTNMDYALAGGPRQTRALQLALQVLDNQRGRDYLLQLSDIPQGSRLHIIGAGFLGDVQDVPWLIQQMALPAFARIAAEAFVTMTGVDVNLEQMESPPPEDFEDGPTEDPDDENVEVPEDVALPWPNVERIQQWWAQHQGRFQAGRRYFLGQPVTRDHCMRVLKEGFQRQRIVAALHLSLLEPGTPLFNTSAPGFRQQQWLG